MTDRFIKFIPSEEAFWLLDNKPNAFKLLTHIANRARREDGHPDGLKAGQCYLGDWKNCGLTRQSYRSSLAILIMREHVKIIETCRTRQKSTTGSTTIGTLVELLSSTVYDINKNVDNHRINHRPTTDQPQTRKKKKEKEIIMASPIFSFESQSFEKLDAADFERWRQAFPGLNIELQLKRMAIWCIDNEKKVRDRKNPRWRTFITNWLEKEFTKEKMQNKPKNREPQYAEL